MGIFDIFRRRPIEVGQFYYRRNNNPFESLWIAKVLEVKNGRHDKEKFIRYESYPESNPRVSGQNDCSESDFRMLYPLKYEKQNESITPGDQTNDS